jgi:hypothetical protein
MISEATKLYLTKKEWSMGNGQCDECCGLGPNWAKGCLNEPLPEETGHKRNCEFAKMLVEMDFDVLYAEQAPQDAKLRKFLGF